MASAPVARLVAAAVVFGALSLSAPPQPVLAFASIVQAPGRAGPARGWALRTLPTP